jgi:hypothetical protein
MLAFRDISEAEWKAWFLKYHDASLLPGKYRSIELQKLAEVTTPIPF